MVYVRERRTISLEEAVRKMSSFPAQRLGLQDRGSLRPGMRADIAILDPARVRDAATFERPHQYAEGVSLVSKRDSRFRARGDYARATGQGAVQTTVNRSRVA